LTVASPTAVADTLGTPAIAWEVPTGATIFALNVVVILGGKELTCAFPTTPLTTKPTISSVVTIGTSPEAFAIIGTELIDTDFAC
jgi:hypothetical protein